MVIDEPVFGQKLTYNKLCNLNSGIVEHKNQNESFSEDESIYNNFCLSAYNIKNNKILSQFNKKFDNDVKIMRHISSYTKFKDKKKLINRSESFDNYRYDYLNLRNDCADRWETVLTLNKKVSLINDILKKKDAHFGYRMRDEIIFYIKKMKIKLR